MLDGITIPYKYKIIKYIGDLSTIRVPASKTIFMRGEPTLIPINEAIKILNSHRDNFEEVKEEQEEVKSKGRPRGNSTSSN